MNYRHGDVLKPVTPPSSSSHSLRRHSAVTSPWSGAYSCCQARFSVLLMKTSSALGLVVTLTSSRKGCRSCWTSYSAGGSDRHMRGYIVLIGAAYSGGCYGQARSSLYD